jgi:hypothetical protein
MTDDLGIIKDAFDEEIKRHKLYKHAKCKTPTQQHERSSKVKHLDDEQIRREKGLSAKPFTSKTDNILWTIVNKGPISSRDIKSFLDKELKADYNITSIAAVLTRLKKLPGVTRTQAGPSSKVYLYSATGLDISKLKTGIYRDAYAERNAALERKLRPETYKQEDLKKVDGVTITAPTPQADAAEAISALVQKLFKGLSLEITIRLK